MELRIPKVGEGEPAKLIDGKSANLVDVEHRGRAGGRSSPPDDKVLWHDPRQHASPRNASDVERQRDVKCCFSKLCVKMHIENWQKNPPTRVKMPLTKIRFERPT